MPPSLNRFILHPLTGRVFLVTLAGVYLIYLAGFAHALFTPSSPAEDVVEHAIATSPTAVAQYWTVSKMEHALDADQPIDQPSTQVQTQASDSTSQSQAALQQGQLPRDANQSYPESTVGKLFFTSSSGLNLVCSGTALVSANHSVVDTAGHCLYWQHGWVQNVLFCPLYDHGVTRYGCWAARDLEVPADWINAGPGQFFHDFGMAIVAPNSEGNLTDVVGGAGWAYNQPVDSLYSAFGYPAAPPFDGQSRQSCGPATGRVWVLGGGKVVSIPCDMTGGSSGGPWFIQIDGNWYLNGHNDFISSIMPKHMFSPYYDDTWYALYSKAQQS
jgi:V8-like Glu-specific endopeptidase